MKRNVFGLVVLLLLVGGVEAAPKLSWQTGTLIEIRVVDGGTTTETVRTGSRSRPIQVPCPPPRPGLFDVCRETARTGNTRTSERETTVVRQHTYHVYEIETETMVYYMTSWRSLNVTVNAPIQFAFEKNKTYLLTEEQHKKGGRVYYEVFLGRKVAKVGAVRD